MPMSSVQAVIPLPKGSDEYAKLSGAPRSEEHTSELQSQSNLVCRLLLEKKNVQPGPPDDRAAPRGRSHPGRVRAGVEQAVYVSRRDGVPYMAGPPRGARTHVTADQDHH